MKRRMVSCMAAAALCMVSPWASAESSRAKIQQLQQQVAVMQGELNSLVAIQKASRGSQAALGDLLNRSQRMDQELRNLRGELEMRTHDLKTRQNAMSAKLDALAATVAAMNGGSATALTASSVSAPARSGAVALALPGETVTSAASSASAPVVQGLGQKEYARAFDYLREGKYGRAVTGLQGFIRKYPQSSLVVDAYYWLGQAQYVLGQNQAAIGSLETVVHNYPQSSKAPEALLRIAEIYQSLGQPGRARSALNLVLKKYSSTPAAQRAQAELQALSH